MVIITNCKFWVNAYENLLTVLKTILMPRPRGYKTFFMLNSAEHEIFSANKYENANNGWHFHIYYQRKFHAQQCLARKNLQLLVILDLLAGQIPCSAELSMKKVL